MNTTQEKVLGPPGAFNRDHVQAMAFLVILPLVNVLLMAALLLNLNMWDTEAALAVFLRLWLTFALSFVILRLLAKYVPQALDSGAFWRQLFIHGIIVVGVGALTEPFVELPASLPRPNTKVMPRIFVFLEVGMYLAVLRILKHQENSFAIAASLREAELNVLRAQSNPHFLFNTLNLIASEISRDPDNAKEVVFDLADLLRSNVKMAEKRVTTVAEEMHLVDLYLKLQQQRFKDRLSFSIEISPDTEALEIPALLLQPVVENTVKWAVAPYASKAHIQVQSFVFDEQLCIVFADTGPAFDDTQVVEGNGFRILRRTLELNYPGQWHLRLSSTPDGGRLSLRVPRRVYLRA